MNQKAKKWLTFTVRWGIAVAGIWYVLAQTPFHDELLIYPPNHHHLMRVRVLDEPSENAETFRVIADPKTGEIRIFPAKKCGLDRTTNTVNLQIDGK